MQHLKSYFHIIHIPPLLPIMICFIMGIIFYSNTLALGAFFACSVLYILFHYVQHTSLQQSVVLCAFFVIFGAWLHQKELHDYDNFYQFVGDEKITVTGTVIDINQTVVNHRKTTATTILVDTIATSNQTQKSNKVMVFYGKSNKNIAVGDTITILDIRCKKPSSENFQHYQIKEQVIATIFDDDLMYKIDNHPSWSLRYFIWNQKMRLLQSLQEKLSSDGFNFFSSLFLGNRACIKGELEETNDLFKIWGISHFLARSGLHLVLFIFLCQALFCIIPLPLIMKQIIMSLLSIIYFFLTWTSAPFTRSFALFILNKICFFNKTPFHLLHYLTLVCFAFLMYCPLYLFFLDFQLSFALTGALAWFNQVTHEHKKI